MKETYVATHALGLVSALCFACTGLSPLVVYAQDAAPTNRVVERLRQGGPVIGTFTRTAGPDIEFAVIDEQYGTFDIDGVREAVVGLRAGNGAPVVTPIVRIPLAARDAPQAVVRQILDAGALGVMFPDIETKAQAMAAVSSMRAAREAGADVWPLDPAGTLVAMLQIETLAGIERLDEIPEVPGIGVIFWDRPILPLRPARTVPTPRGSTRSCTRSSRCASRGTSHVAIRSWRPRAQALNVRRRDDWAKASRLWRS